MGKVQLKLPPEIASMLDRQGSDWLVFEQPIAEGTTIGDLLVGLTSSYHGFRKVVFNPAVGKVGEQLMVVLNDSLLQGTDVAEAKLNDGDTVMLLPIYAGG